MKAARIHEHGGTEVLKWEEIPEPIPSADEVLIDIQAAAVNHLDIWVRNGIPGVPLPLIMGSDGSGIVKETGESVSGVTVGDEVVIHPLVWCEACRGCKTGRQNYCDSMGIIGESQNGTMAERVVFPEKNVKAKPPNLKFEEAAALPLVGQTAYTMLVRRAEIQPGETLLVWGAGSGVGSMAVQIARHIGCRVIATAGSDSKCSAAKELGAEFAINHYEDDVVKTVKEITAGKGVDVVFEHVGKSTWDTSMKSLAKGGRLVTCGATTGPKVEIDLRHLFFKQQSIMGSTMGDETALDEILKLAESGNVKPVVDRSFPMSEIQEAHRVLESSEQFGKVVLIP